MELPSQQVGIIAFDVDTTPLSNVSVSSQVHRLRADSLTLHPFFSILYPFFSEIGEILLIVKEG